MAVPETWGVKKGAKVFGVTSTAEQLPIKVVGDGGTPELGKLVCSVE